MKHQKSCGPHLGKLVHQLPRVINFSYDLCFRSTIAHWKFLSEEYTCSMWRTLKMMFRASKHPRKLGTRKLGKNCRTRKMPKWANWNRWDATDIHLDHFHTREKREENHHLLVGVWLYFIVLYFSHFIYFMHNQKINN